MKQNGPKMGSYSWTWKRKWNNTNDQSGDKLWMGNENDVLKNEDSMNSKNSKRGKKMKNDVNDGVQWGRDNVKRDIYGEFM